MFAWACVHQHQIAMTVICFTDKTHSAIDIVPIPHHDGFFNKIWPVEMTADKKVGSHTVDTVNVKFIEEGDIQSKPGINAHIQAHPTMPQRPRTR